MYLIHDRLMYHNNIMYRTKWMLFAVGINYTYSHQQFAIMKEPWETKKDTENISYSWLVQISSFYARDQVQCGLSHHNSSLCEGLSLLHKTFWKSSVTEELFTQFRFHGVEQTLLFFTVLSLKWMLQRIISIIYSY